MASYLIALLISSIIIGLIPAAIAEKKGENFVVWWLFGAGFFIIALPVAIVMKPNSKAVERSALSYGMKKCNQCAELVKAEAKICRFCGNAFEDESGPSRCPLCKSVIADSFLMPGINECPSCHRTFNVEI